MDSHILPPMGWDGKKGGRFHLVSVAQELGGDQWSAQFAQLEPKSRGLHPEDELATVESIAAMALPWLCISDFELMCC